MKKIILTTTALLLSGNLYAGIYGGFGDVGNPDLYRGEAESNVLPTAVQPGIGDSYGSAVFKEGFSDHGHVSKMGTNEGYGSILLDLNHKIDW